jgi:hypothetical protein
MLALALPRSEVGAHVRTMYALSEEEAKKLSTPSAFPAR